MGIGVLDVGEVVRAAAMVLKQLRDWLVTSAGIVIVV
jgi:hypothetical protein